VRSKFTGDQRVVDELTQAVGAHLQPPRDAAHVGAALAHAARSGAGVDFDTLEVYFGESDLLPSNYLGRGTVAARAAALVTVPNALGTEVDYGTGFLIGPGLFVTNNHVLADAAAASRATVDFDFALDDGGQMLVRRTFRLAPDAAFFTVDKTDLDFTVVAIAETGVSGDAIGQFGFLRLDAQTGKTGPGNWVSVVEHPGAQAKRIAIRENQVVKYGDALHTAADDFLWYHSDTAPGASGAPVFNDNWQVVAVHHAGIPETRKRADGATEIHLMDDSWVADDADVDENRIVYLANEGVRVSSVIARIDAALAAAAPDPAGRLRALADDATGRRAFPNARAVVAIASPDLETLRVPAAPEAPAAAEAPAAGTPLRLAFEAARTSKVHPPEFYTGRGGYDPEFLGVSIPLPRPGDESRGRVAGVAGATDGVLRYEHYSVIFNADRKLAYVSAVNIGGDRYYKITRGTDVWWYDGRLSADMQVGMDFYGKEPSLDVAGKGWFDLGHLTRRADPDWGDADTAERADGDTFHFTNCSPQYWRFNQGIGDKGQKLWAGLEDFVLNNVRTDKLRASVFNGPIFAADDETHRGVKIPKQFFKVVAVVDADSKLRASAYLLSQAQWATNIPFEKLPVGPQSDSENYTIAIRRLAATTGLDFGALYAADVFPGDAQRFESFDELTALHAAVS
jgi:endonuclease G